MQAKRVSGDPDLLRSPEQEAWASVPAESVVLAATPAESQPSRYVRRAVTQQQWGAAKEAKLQAAHDGRNLYFRLEWRDGSEDVRHEEGRFPDAAALLFPVNGEAPLASMGSPAQPVNAWFWRPDFEGRPQNLVARGLGTVERDDGQEVAASASWRDGVWNVVLCRPLGAGNGTAVDLRPGSKTSVAVAIWDGGSGERAGLKAYSQAWRELELEP